MPPRRPRPYLCDDLISVMKMLTLNDQLKAAQMSPRSAVLVRAANRRVKKLVITSTNRFEWIKDSINSQSLASYPSMQLLPAGGEPFPDYPMTTTRISKWNCLLVHKDQRLDQPTVEQIVDAFSAVTDLKFDMSTNDHLEKLIALLERQEWTNQLTSLAFACSWVYNGNHQQPELSILAQLKMAVILSGPLTEDFFHRSLERHAAGNVDLQLFLINFSHNELLGFSEPLRSRIFRTCRGRCLDCRSFIFKPTAVLAVVFISANIFKASIAKPQIQAPRLLSNASVPHFPCFTPVFLKTESFWTGLKTAWEIRVQLSRN
ncbi:hypothetical protein TYRP_016890 [Tyrophagus putrescentiae]|nr:hypothetical protein TYRP_016890 [Tyrophagus putrescentiae]